VEPVASLVGCTDGNNVIPATESLGGVVMVVVFIIDGDDVKVTGLLAG